MKIKTTITEIECTAEELRQSNSLSDGFTNMVRNFFNGQVTEEKIDCDKTDCSECVNKGTCDYEGAD